MPKPAIQDMRNFFENPFDNNPRISDDNLKKFSEEHLGRLTANNPGGALDIILTPMGAAHLAYFGAISDEDIDAAVRKGMTKAVDDKIAEFKTLVKKREPLIRSAFIDDEPTYLQFFPQGITEYSVADKGNVETLMVRMATQTSEHSTAVGSAVATAFAALRTSYATLRAAQIGKKGEVADDKDTTAAKRDVVEKQLWKNVHYIAWYYEGDVEQCMAYFDQSMLRQGANSGEGGTGGQNYTGSIDNGEMITIVTLDYVAGKSITVKNTGDSDLLLFLNVTAGPPEGTPLNVAAGAEETRTMGQLNPDTTATILRLKSSGEDGEYIVTVEA